MIAIIVLSPHYTLGLLPIKIIMESLPSEILNEIIKAVDKPSLFFASQVCREWRLLALRQVITIKSFKDFRIACQKGDHLSIIKSDFDKSWVDVGLYSACYGGHLELVELLITKDTNNGNYFEDLIIACEGRHLKVAELLIAKGADNWDCALYGACTGGHRELVELLINKGATNFWDCFENVCTSGHIDLVSYFIAKGVDN